MLELGSGDLLGLSVVVDQHEAAFGEQAGQALQAGDGPVVVEDGHPGRAACFGQGEVGEGDLFGAHGKVVILREAERIDLEQLLAPGRICRCRHLLQLRDAGVGVGAPGVSWGQTGADAQLLSLLALDAEYARRQTVEQVVEEHGAERAGTLGGEVGVGQYLVGVEGVDEAQTVASGVVVEEPVASGILEHARRAVGGDVGETVVVVCANLVAQLAQTVEEEAGEQADADAQLQDEDVAGEEASAVGFEEAGEEDFGGGEGEVAIVVDHEGDRLGIPDEGPDRL